MNRKAFSLLELIFAAIIGMAVMLGSVGVLENMQKESNNFQSRISEDMNWIEANRHLAQMVRSSSYLDIPIAAASTLVLYNYGGVEIGRYVNDAGNYKIDYTDKSTGAITTFKRVNAAFSALSIGPSGKGWRNNKQVETKVVYTVDYTAPSTKDFTSEVSLSCRTAVAGVVPPSSSWHRTYGGDYYDELSFIQQTKDGGYIIVGQTASYGAGNWDVYLIKTDNKGVSTWSKTFGALYSEYAYTVQQTLAAGVPDGYIIAGQYFAGIGVTGNAEAALIRTNLNGDAGPGQGWVRTFGSWQNEIAFSAQKTSDGGYVIAGTSYHYAAPVDYWDVYLLKTNSSGTNQWGPKTFGGNSYEQAYSIQQTTDGGYIMVGRTSSFGAGGYDVYLLKTDSNGALQWAKTFGGAGDDVGNSVQQTTDGGYIIAGYTSSFGAGGYDVYLIKTDSNGDASAGHGWSKTFGGSSYDLGYSVQQTTDGGYIIAGATHSFGAGNYDYYLIKTDLNGTFQWSKTFGGADDDIANSVQQTTDGGYIIAGITYSFDSGFSWLTRRGYVVKTDSQGGCADADAHNPPAHDLGIPTQDIGVPTHS